MMKTKVNVPTNVRITFSSLDSISGLRFSGSLLVGKLDIAVVVVDSVVDFKVDVVVICVVLC